MIWSLLDIDEMGCNIRAWCYACQHTAVIDPVIRYRFERRGWSIYVDEARLRFRCSACGSSADVLLVPASIHYVERPPPEPISWEREVVAFFHRSRAEDKAARRRR